eukprot:COSAG01_NODE_1558_length_9925_cov_6.973743_10_plen_100_part_00
MGHTVERRPRGAGRPFSTHPSRGYGSATRVHVQARLRMQDVHLIPNKGTIRHSLFYSLGGLLGDLTQPAQPGRPSAGACHCLSNRIPLSAGWLLQAIFR